MESNPGAVAFFAAEPHSSDAFVQASSNASCEAVGDGLGHDRVCSPVVFRRTRRQFLQPSAGPAQADESASPAPSGSLKSGGNAASFLPFAWLAPESEIFQRSVVCSSGGGFVRRALRHRRPPLCGKDSVTHRGDRFFLHKCDQRTTTLHFRE